MKKLIISLLVILTFLGLMKTFSFSLQAVTPDLSPTPSGTEEEKVKEIRDAVKDKVNEIKDKIEKKAYVGTITQITDSTLAINNFRGTQRVRLVEETTIVGTSRKVIKPADLAVDDKVIAMGTISENEILEALRVIVVAPPKTVPLPRTLAFGTISSIDRQQSTLTLSLTGNPDNSKLLKIDSKTMIVSAKDSKTKIAFKNLEENQKTIAVFWGPFEAKTSVAKTIFVFAE